MLGSVYHFLQPVAPLCVDTVAQHTLGLIDAVLQVDAHLCHEVVVGTQVAHAVRPEAVSVGTEAVECGLPEAVHAKSDCLIGVVGLYVVDTVP